MGSAQGSVVLHTLTLAQQSGHASSEGMPVALVQQQYHHNGSAKVQSTLAAT